ncbi:hypothetical protein L2E82_50001 [Cichorium intybus]|nr:hypothetical protein L2E82_50001 [Cichorium intybus]
MSHILQLHASVSCPKQKKKHYYFTLLPKCSKQLSRNPNAPNIRFRLPLTQLQAAPAATVFSGSRRFLRPPPSAPAATTSYHLYRPAPPPTDLLTVFGSSEHFGLAITAVFSGRPHLLQPQKRLTPSTGS